MSKRAMAALALIQLLALLFSPLRGAADQQKLLVLYQFTDGSASESAFRLIEKQIMYMNLEADYRSVYEKSSSLADYSGVVIIVEDGRAISAEWLEALAEGGLPQFVLGQGALPFLTEGYAYQRGSIVVRCDAGDSGGTGDMLVRGDGLTLLTGDTEALSGTIFIGPNAYPLCQRRGLITHLAYMDAEQPAMRATLANALQLWMWPYENSPVSYGQYLVLEGVYPFGDPARLMRLGDALDAIGVPYALSVMPIYFNANYPSMKRFCEYLRYEQSKGTGIILHAPLVTLAQVEADELRKQIDIAYEAYSSYGVYPLAIQASEEYLFSEKGIETLAGFRTVFLFETDESAQKTVLKENIAYKEGHQLIASAYTDSNAFTAAYPQAVYVDAHQDFDTILTFVKRLNTTRRTFKSLPQMDTSIYTGDDHIALEMNELYVNGKLTDLSYQPFTYEDNYVFDRGIVQYLTDQIEGSNRVILLFVSLACVGIAVMIILSRKLLRRSLILGLEKSRRKTTAKENGDQEVHIS